MSLRSKLFFSSLAVIGMMSPICVMPVSANEILGANVASDDNLPASALSPSINVNSDVASSGAELFRAQFDRFIPRPSKGGEIYYNFWNRVISEMAIDQGLSDRVRRAAPRGFKNGRMTIPTGHTSPYRLEGSLIFFSEAAKKKSFRADIKSYRAELEQLGTDRDISSLNRDEQLAYWFNLHNVAVFDIILSNFPERDLDQMTINGEQFDDAKLINVKGTALSLKDIRHNIVYRNWDDPVVMYGFFHGYIGGPSLRMSAYRPENLDAHLQKGANEFTNSLRGFEPKKNKLDVSQLYSDATHVYFQDFQTDLKDHFEKYMRPEVFQIADTQQKYRVIKFDTDVSDVRAGRRIPKIVGAGLGASSAQVSGVDRSAYGIFRREVGKKRENLRQQGLWQSEVTIEDTETEDNSP